MQVCPQDSTTNVFDGLEQMVVVVPVDAKKHETEQIAHGRRQKGLQGRPSRLVWWPKLDHHYGDDDGDDAIAKGFKASLGHQPLTYVPTSSPLTARSSEPV